MPNTETKDLNFDSFLKTDRATWLNKIQRDLKLDSLDGLLQNFENYFKITPFADESFVEENNIHPIVIPLQNINYLVAEIFNITNDNVAVTNKNLLEALMRGVQTSIFFVRDVVSSNNFKILLSQVSAEYLFLHFYFLESAEDDFKKIESNIFQFLNAVSQKKDETHTELSGAMNINATVFSKMTLANHRLIFESFVPVLPNFYFFYIESLNTSHETNNVVAQIVSIAAQLKTFFEIGEKNNLPVQVIADKMRIRVSVGTKFYTEIAKLRALRIVYANILKCWSLQPRDLPIDVVYHPIKLVQSIHNNKISATVQVLAAYLGGANTVAPVSNLNSTEDENQAKFDTRIFGNIQNILQLESGIPQVNDVAAGSYYIEQLTTRIAEAAWKIISV